MLFLKTFFSMQMCLWRLMDWEHWNLVLINYKGRQLLSKIFHSAAHRSLSRELLVLEELLWVLHWDQSWVTLPELFPEHWTSHTMGNPVQCLSRSLLSKIADLFHVPVNLWAFWWEPSLPGGSSLPKCNCTLTSGHGVQSHEKPQPQESAKLSS